MLLSFSERFFNTLLQSTQATTIFQPCISGSSNLSSSYLSDCLVLVLPWTVIFISVISVRITFYSPLDWGHTHICSFKLYYLQQFLKILVSFPFPFFYILVSLVIITVHVVSEILFCCLYWFSQVMLNAILGLSCVF